MRKFIKQYGEKRTGTNYLRALLASACPEAQVLMHILGNKHDAPPEALLRGDADLRPWDLTLRHASTTTTERDPRQAAYTGSLAPDLAEALWRKEVLFCISVKNPYAWAFSMLKQHGAADTRNIRPQRLRLLQTVLSAECGEFNRKYAAWLGMARTMPRQSVVVRYEQLLEDPASVVSVICDRLGLPFDAGSVRPLPNIVLPAHWDFSPPETHHEPFDGDFYRSAKYLRKMHPALAAVIDEQIDWPLMAAFGYANQTSYQL